MMLNMPVHKLADEFCLSDKKECSECAYKNFEQFCPILCLAYGKPIESDIDTLTEALNVLKEYDKKQHPTYLDDFLSKFPDAPMTDDGLPEVCATSIYKNATMMCESSSFKSSACYKCWNKKLQSEL